jgi:hypothetical protein
VGAVVEADVDGDEVYEFNTGRVHFPGANTLPVADADEDAIGNVGCPISIDGSKSADADLDALQYKWMVVSAPMASAFYGHADTVKLLLARDAHVNVKDEHGWTALMIAEDQSHQDIVSLLKQAGATGQGLLCIAALKGQTEKIKSLLDKGIHINAKDEICLKSDFLSVQAMVLWRSE